MYATDDYEMKHGLGIDYDDMAEKQVHLDPMEKSLLPKGRKRWLGAKVSRCGFAQ